MRMTVLIGSALLLGSGLPAVVNAQQSDISAEIIEQDDGTRTLLHEAEIDAPIARVWDSFTTEEGWKNWGPKFALIDMRQGGTIESSYHKDAMRGDKRNIVHRILAIVPERMIAMRLERVPEGGPVGEEVMAKTWTVYQLEPVDESRTKLTILGLGYGEGEAFDKVIGFFHSGNSYSIELLRRNLAASAAEDNDTEEGE